MLYPVKIEFKEYPSGSWQDWSEYLSEPPQISKKVESENEGEAGLIVFDDAEVSFRYESGSPVYDAFSIDLSAKQRYLFRISAPKTDKTFVQLFEGIADFSSLRWNEFSNVVSFNIVDKLSALNILQNVPVRTLRSLKDSTVNHLPWLVPLDYANGDYYIINVGTGNQVVFEVIKYIHPSFTPQHIDVGSTAVVSAGTILKRMEADGDKHLFAKSSYLFEANNPGENDTWLEPSGDSDNITGSFRIDSTDADAYLISDPSVKLKYYKDEFYSSNICNTSYYWDSLGYWKTEVTSFKGEKILQYLINQAWPGILITFRGFSTFDIPYSYWRKTMDENPFGKTPLDALKMLADTMKVYIFVDRTGNVIIQNKSTLATSGITRSIGSTKIISGPEKKYFWDKLIDGIIVNVESWVTDETTGESLVGTSELTKQPSGFTSTQKIKPKNSITKDILAGDSSVDTQEELNALAATEALAFLNFYGLRHSSFDMVLNLDDNTIEWELIDNIILSGLTTFFTTLEFDLVERTVKLQPVEIQGHDYDLRQITVGSPEASSSGIGGSSSSGVSSYYGVTPIFNLPLQMSGGIVSLLKTDNLKLTSNQLDTIQPIKITDTPTFNQILLSAAATLSNHAVRADRTLQITTNAPLTGGGIAVDLTANRSWTLGISSANLLGTTNQINVANGTGVILGLTNVTLSLPQNIHTGATPTFNQLTLSSAGSGSSNAVRADRTLQITTTAPLTGGGVAVDLTADRNWTLGINSASLLGTTNQINVANGTGVILGLTNVTLSLPQNIHTAATPTFNQLTLSSAGSGSSNAVRADRTLQITTTAPLTGGGIAVDLTANRSWTLGISSANLLGTTNRITVTNGTGVILGTSNVTLNLPQDIHTAAIPTFAGLTINGNILQTTNSYIKNNFNSGWAGSGWQLDYSVTETNRSHLEVDRLTVRGTMRVFELLINQIRATNGSLFVSSTAKVQAINNGTVGDVRLTFETPSGNYCPFTNNDILLMQIVDLNGTSIIRKVVGTVANGSVSGATLELNLTVGLVSDIKIGDTFVRLGSTSNSSRKGNIYLTSDDTASPYIDIVDGVTSYSDWATPAVRKVRLGKLTGLSDSDFGNLSGYGLYTTNAYLKGGIWASFGNIAGWTITSAQMSKIYTHPVTGEANEIALNATSNDIGLHVWMDKEAVNVPSMLSIGAIKDYTNTLSANEYGIQYQRGSDTYFRLTNSVQQIAGWNFNNLYLWKLTSGTPTSSPAGGIVMNSNGAITVYGNYWQKRVALYYSATNNWGLIGTNESYQTVFQLGYTNQIAGWAFDTVKLTKGSATLGISLNTGSTPFITGTSAKGFEVYDSANPKLFIGQKDGNSLDWNITSANVLTIKGEIKSSRFSTTVGYGGAYSYAVIDSDINGFFMRVQNYTDSSNITDVRIQPYAPDAYGNVANLMSISTTVSGATQNINVNKYNGYLGISINGAYVPRYRGNGTSLPTTDLRDGDMYYFTSTGKVYVYASGGWRVLN